MATLKIQCFREQVRACCFENYAEIILENYNTGDHIEFSGKLQTSIWEKNGSKFYSFQINIDGIAGHEIPEKIVEVKPVRPGLENVDYSGGPF